MEYRKLSDKRIRLKRKLAKAKTEEEKQSLLESIWELDKVHKSIPCKDPMDENFRRLQYVRYADDFLIGIIGAKEDAQAVKQEIGTYIAGQLKLELSDEKTLVTKATDRAKFLGFENQGYTAEQSHQENQKWFYGQKLQRPCHAGSPNFRHSEEAAGTGSHENRCSQWNRDLAAHPSRKTCRANGPEYS